ncbi:hypothetical protein BC628DRAFT_972679 [Trametes gibbosa]|nr:hypothetical protein BC628DRAFT_972679 [Trametes gibbosa]
MWTPLIRCALPRRPAIRSLSRVCEKAGTTHPHRLQESRKMWRLRILETMVMGYEERNTMRRGSLMTSDFQEQSDTEVPFYCQCTRAFTRRSQSMVTVAPTVSRQTVRHHDFPQRSRNTLSKPRFRSSVTRATWCVQLYTHVCAWLTFGIAHPDFACAHRQ